MLSFDGDDFPKNSVDADDDCDNDCDDDCDNDCNDVDDNMQLLNVPDMLIFVRQMLQHY